MIAVLNMTQHANQSYKQTVVCLKRKCSLIDNECKAYSTHLSLLYCILTSKFLFVSTLSALYSTISDSQY
jgi:hypothetical protein